MLHPKRGFKVLKLTPLHFLLRFAPSLMNKMTVFQPTERLLEYSFIHENVPFDGEGKILDVGCGSSILPFELACKGYKVFAIDLKRQYPKTLHHSNFTFIQGDIRKTKFSDNFFDIVTAVSSIEHIGLGSKHINLNGDKKALKEITRILKPTGIFLMTVPFGKRGLYPSKDNPSWRVYDLYALKELISPLQIETIRFAILGEDLSWKPAKLEEAEQIDSLSQHTWYSSKAVAMVRAKKLHAL
jgi:ubiquinone/menaquinone biosynthesis C-methylase UbiE